MCFFPSLPMQIAPLMSSHLLTKKNHLRISMNFLKIDVNGMEGMPCLISVKLQCSKYAEMYQFHYSFETVTRNQFLYAVLKSNFAISSGY